MLEFGKDFIEETKKETDERASSFGGDNREKISVGVNDLYLVDIKLDVDAQKIPVVKLEINKDIEGTFKPITKFFKFDDQGINENAEKKEKLVKVQKMFLEFFYRAFGVSPKPGNLQAVVNQFTAQCKGKKFKGAVQHKEGIFEKKKGTEVIGVIIITRAELYYVGLIGETEFTMKADKYYVKLNSKDKEYYEDFKNQHPERYDEKGAFIYKEDAPEPAKDQESEDIFGGAQEPAPFTDEPELKPEPKPVAKKSAPAPKKEEAKPAAPAADDDLPWD